MYPVLERDEWPNQPSIGEVIDDLAGTHLLIRDIVKLVAAGRPYELQTEDVVNYIFDTGEPIIYKFVRGISVPGASGGITVTELNYQFSFILWRPYDPDDDDDRERGHGSEMWFGRGDLETNLTAALERLFARVEVT